MKNMIGIGVLGIIEIYIPWCFYFHKGVWACERVTKAGGSLGKGTAQACQAGLPVLSCLPSFLPSFQMRDCLHQAAEANSAFRGSMAQTPRCPKQMGFHINYQTSGLWTVLSTLRRKHSADLITGKMHTKTQGISHFSR